MVQVTDILYYFINKTVLINKYNCFSKHKRQQELMEKEMVYGSKPATTPKKRY